MLFDLRGRRRRAVQATYLTLAVLMGGGLVLFGIGGDVSGGLFDAFSGNSSNTTDNSQLDEAHRRAEEAAGGRTGQRGRACRAGEAQLPGGGIADPVGIHDDP